MICINLKLIYNQNSNEIKEKPLLLKEIRVVKKILKLIIL